MTNAINEYLKLKQRLSEPEPMAKIESKKRGRPAKTSIIKPTLQTSEELNEQQKILKLIQAEREKLLFRQTELAQEQADIEIKIAGLNYVDDMIIHYQNKNIKFT